MTFAGQEARVLAEDVAGMRAVDDPFSWPLLPAFDPWVIGMAREDPFVDPHHVSDVFRPAGRIAPVVLGDGRVSGRWTHRRERNCVQLAIHPYRSIPRRGCAAVTEEAERIAGHLGRPSSCAGSRPDRPAGYTASVLRLPSIGA